MSTFHEGQEVEVYDDPQRHSFRKAKIVAALHQVTGAISEFNQRLYAGGLTLHFAVHKVGDDDPKGPGFRVLRDDKPIRHRSKKREATP